MAEMILVIENGPLSGERYALQKDVLTIGRDAACDIRLDDASVSRHHARLITRNGVVMFDDLGSRNGSEMNGERVEEPVEMRLRDQVRVGLNVMMHLEIADHSKPNAPEVKEPTERVVNAGPAPYSLVVRSGEQCGQILPMHTGQHSLGRGRDNKLRLTDKDVSNHHAVVHVESDGRIWVQDLKSSNGTYVNKSKVLGPTSLQSGDMMQVGASVVVEIQNGIPTGPSDI